MSAKRAVVRKRKPVAPKVIVQHVPMPEHEHATTQWLIAALVLGVIILGCCVASQEERFRKIEKQTNLLVDDGGWDVRSVSIGDRVEEVKASLDRTIAKIDALAGRSRLEWERDVWGGSGGEWVEAGRADSVSVYPGYFGIRLRNLR